MPRRIQRGIFAGGEDGRNIRRVTWRGRRKCRWGQDRDHIMLIETTVFDMWAVVQFMNQPRFEVPVRDGEGWNA
ncbi:hypothetical protein D5086_001204 [Populus alba]